MKNKYLIVLCAMVTFTAGNSPAQMVTTAAGAITSMNSSIAVSRNMSRSEPQRNVTPTHQVLLRETPQVKKLRCGIQRTIFHENNCNEVADSDQSFLVTVFGTTPP